MLLQNMKHRGITKIYDSQFSWVAKWIGTQISGFSCMVNELIFCFVETVLVDLLEMEGGHEIHENYAKCFD